MAVRATSTMNISKGLEYFISNALVKNKRDRFKGFLSSDKGHKKFARSLDHDFEKAIDKSTFVTSIDKKEMEQAGNLYCSNGVTNDSDTSMADLYGKAPWEGGWLLLNKEGTFAIYRPEGRIDDQIYIKL